jgi:hypothetical protein
LVLEFVHRRQRLACMNDPFSARDTAALASATRTAAEHLGIEPRSSSAASRYLDYHEWSTCAGRHGNRVCMHPPCIPNIPRYRSDHGNLLCNIQLEAVAPGWSIRDWHGTSMFIYLMHSLLPQ